MTGAAELLRAWEGTPGAPPLRLPELPRGARVAVAMSGGVDSSVAAALCVAAGHPTFGIMLRLWAEPGARAANKCCSPGAIADASSVAARLDIPFNVLDAEDRFHEAIVAPFLAASRAGDTPNPCFECNRAVRYGHLLAQARALGADILVTGHYARVGQGPSGSLALLRGVDAAKDQAYMLHRLGQAELAHAAFPLGVYRKPEVRALATLWGLSVAARPDSVDLCWTGESGLRGFLSRQLPAEALIPGPILDGEGRVLGRHDGLPYYTLGQRKGLGVATGTPSYVVGRDAARNALILGPAEQLLTDRVRLRPLHWASGAPPAGPELHGLTAEVRYHAPAVAIALELAGDDAAEVRFDQPQRAPAVGQGLVIYRGDRVLGGGRIDALLRDDGAPEPAGPRERMA